jgi:two-component system sensor histidine kinase BaeS
MQFKLSYKIFIAFTLMSLLVVVLMVGLIRFYVTRNFADYVNKSLLERYSDFADALATEYQTHRGWQALKDNPGRWQEILKSSLPRTEFDLQRAIPQSSGVESEGSNSSDRELPSSGPSRRILRLARRLVLFDADKKHIAGGRARVSHDSYTLLAIAVDDKTVGWLGLHKRENLSNPLAVGFLKQQSQMLYFIGGGILVLAAIVALLLSRHLLAPVRKLTAGTRTLASRQFDTRIRVDSWPQISMPWPKLWKIMNACAGNGFPIFPMNSEHRFRFWEAKSRRSKTASGRSTKIASIPCIQKSGI